MTQRNQVDRTFAELLNTEGDFYRQAVDPPRAAQALRRAVKLRSVLSGKDGLVVTPCVENSFSRALMCNVRGIHF